MERGSSPEVGVGVVSRDGLDEVLVLETGDQ